MGKAETTRQIAIANCRSRFCEITPVGLITLPPLKEDLHRQKALAGRNNFDWQCRVSALDIVCLKAFVRLRFQKSHHLRDRLCELWHSDYPRAARI